MNAAPGTLGGIFCPDGFSRDFNPTSDTFGQCLQSELVPDARYQYDPDDPDALPRYLKFCETECEKIGMVCDTAAEPQPGGSIALKCAPKDSVYGSDGSKPPGKTWVPNDDSVPCGTSRDYTWAECNVMLAQQWPETGSNEPDAQSPPPWTPSDPGYVDPAKMQVPPPAAAEGQETDKKTSGWFVAACVVGGLAVAGGVTYAVCRKRRRLSARHHTRQIREINGPTASFSHSASERPSSVNS